MKNFALIGAAGYIAPRHLKAIKETGHQLVAAMDTSDSVGILDSDFPHVEFFTEFEQFASFIGDLRYTSEKVDYLSICSPNYLHAPHIKFALQNNIDVICEKPLVMSVSELDAIKKYEADSKATVSSILQLRLHPSILALKKIVENSSKSEKFEVDLTYLTSRGTWYLRSWKGRDQHSGGIAANIGVHFFDMLHFIFGPLQSNELYFRDDMTASGHLEFENARVRWFLSIDARFLPENAVIGEKKTFRSITIDGEELEFSGGFTDLHTLSYQSVLKGQGFGLEENRAAITAVEKIRNTKNFSEPSHPHPYLEKALK